MSLDNTVAFLRCAEGRCPTRYPIDSRYYSCPQCGGLLDVDYDFSGFAAADALKQLFLSRRTEVAGPFTSGVWRFLELIPFVKDLDSIITLREGNTPLYRGRRSAEYAGLDAVSFKHQGMNPTGSFKDNGMTTAITMARQVGATAVACASTGNTSASLAAYAASAGMKAVVFVPAGQISYGKLSQALEYGAMVIEIEGSFDDAMRLVREIAQESELYLLNSVNPFRLEGQKTIIVELMEQLGWSPPDWIVVPGGNLGNSSAFGKALHEMHDLKLIDRIPRLAIIQAKGAAPFYSLVRCGKRDELVPVSDPSTLATAIRIGNPVSWKKALRALDWTNGVVEQANEHEIAEAKAVIGSDGIGCEPASAVTLAGLRKLVAAETVARDASVICVLTGNLLKDPNYTIDYHTRRLAIDDSGERRIMVTRANKPVRSPADKGHIKSIIGIN